MCSPHLLLSLSLSFISIPLASEPMPSGCGRHFWHESTPRHLRKTRKRPPPCSLSRVLRRLPLCLFADPGQWHRRFQLGRRWVGAKIIAAAGNRLAWRPSLQNQKVVQ
ncbi:hypothetical protein PVAP13_9KG577200 [Panicum virgatum]|uniref:Secreted protein n=1 Tax=Panicum virgatum TaxID=38727 RepID=A0A8T0P1J4_PANVG|nr:hypothetical protein PVAP13_9KG577200 [Panicum virgatum]